MDELWRWIGLNGEQALAVVASTAVLYLVFVAFLALAGRRLRASPSSFEIAIVTILGAIVGRSMMGHTPTMAGGLVALITLTVLGLSSGVLRRLQHATAGRAWLVATAQGVDPEALRRCGLRERDLWTALRLQGVRHLDEVQAVIVESHGGVSVLRAGHELDPRIMTGVRRSDSRPAARPYSPGS